MVILLQISGIYLSKVLGAFGVCNAISWNYSTLQLLTKSLMVSTAVSLHIVHQNSGNTCPLSWEVENRFSIRLNEIVTYSIIGIVYLLPLFNAVQCTSDTAFRVVAGSYNWSVTL